jgi:hypothetical protein
MIKIIKQIAYAKGQHDLTCKLLAIDPNVDANSDTLYEEVCYLLSVIKELDEYIKKNGKVRVYKSSMYHQMVQDILSKTKFDQ